MQRDDDDDDDDIELTLCDTSVDPGTKLDGVKAYANGRRRRLERIRILNKK